MSRMSRKERKALREKELILTDHVNALKQAHPDHPIPITRRDFFEQGLLAGTTYIAIPSVLSQLFHSATAKAESAYDFPAYLEIFLSGGASMQSMFVPSVINSTDLPSDTALPIVAGEVPDTLRASLESPFGTPQMGAPVRILRTNSFWDGFMAISATAQADAPGGALTPAEIAATKMVVMPLVSANDGNAPANATSLVTAIESFGKITDSGVVGISNSDTVGLTGLDSNYSTTSPLPVPIGSVTTLNSALSFNPQFLPANIRNEGSKRRLGAIADAIKTLTGRKISSMDFTDLNRVGPVLEKAVSDNQRSVQSAPSVDPRDVGNPLADLFPNNLQPNSQRAILGAYIRASLEQNINGQIAMGGYDYHGAGTPANRVNADIRDREFGSTLRLVIKSAHRIATARNKEIVISVTTNGGNSGQAATAALTPRVNGWDADTGRGCRLLIVVTPASRPARTQVRAQLGGLRPDGNVENTAITGTARGATTATFYNYLRLAGYSRQEAARRLGILEEVAAGMEMFA